MIDGGGSEEGEDDVGGSGKITLTSECAGLCFSTNQVRQPRGMAQAQELELAFLPSLFLGKLGTYESRAKRESLPLGPLDPSLLNVGGFTMEAPRGRPVGSSSKKGRLVSHLSFLVSHQCRHSEQLQTRAT